MAYVTQRRSLIRRLLNGQPRELTFSRTGTAYSPDTGASVASGEPRFPWQSGYQGVMVEEAATNLLTANQSSVETDTTGFSAQFASVLTRVTTEAKFGSASLQVDTTSSNANQGVLVSIPAGTLSASTTYTISLYVKGAGNLRVWLQEVTGGAIVGSQTSFTATSSWQRVTCTVTMGGVVDAAGHRIRIDTAGVAQTVTFYLDGLQVEAKAYPTSWTLGGTTRNAETLTIPTAGVLKAEQGTVIARFRADVPLSAIRYLLDVGGSGTSGLVFFVGSTGKATIQAGTGAAQRQATSTTTLTQSQTVTVGWRWTTSEISVAVNGVIEAATADAFAPVLRADAYIGSQQGRTDRHLCGVIDSLHIFDEALSDSLMAQYTTSPPTAPTDKHTLFLPFSGNLAPYGRGFSLGDYQETFGQ